MSHERPKPLKTGLFVQLFQAVDKGNIECPLYWPFVRGMHILAVCEGNAPVFDELPSQRVSKAFTYHVSV